MADDNTLFDLPNTPEEFGVVLPSASLRQIDFSALEFSTARRAIFEYVRTYYPDTFNDFVANNGFVMLSEVLAYLMSVASIRMDVIANNFFLPTSTDRDTVANHLALINRPIKRQTPAVVDIAVSVQTPVFSAIRIQPGLQFALSGADGKPLIYELYRAPGDFTNPIEIPPGKRGIIGFGIEGRFASPITSVSNGAANQVIKITDADILDMPIDVDVTTGSTTIRWKRVESIASGIPSDEIFEVQFLADGALVLFGDNKTGKTPLAGQIITISYRTGGGIRGRIGSGEISETRTITPEPPASAPVEVTFRNLLPSNGGRDEESIQDAKKRAPKEAAAQKSATTGEDYAVLAGQFNHPVFGSVLKAVATVRSNINANIIELYILAEGPDNVPTLPSEGLKQGLVSFFEGINVLTDQVKALDGAIKPIDLHVEIVISRSADASFVRDQVTAVIDGFFDVTKKNLGDALYLSHLYEAIQKVDGVSFVTILSPNDNIMPTGNLANPEAQGVGFNELIVLGQKTLDFYFEKLR
jgi:hypothetical protein